MVGTAAEYGSPVLPKSGKLCLLRLVMAPSEGAPMRSTFVSCLAILLLATTVERATAAPTTADAIESATRSAQSRFGIPGISVAVMVGGKLVYARGFGLADVASRAPATAQTVYPFGSIAKQFTAAAVLKLAGEGRFALADPVAKHVPEYWPHGNAATLEYLLRHTSGVREFFSVPAAAKLIEDPRGTMDEVMAIVARERLVFPTGSRWSYSNSGYHLAARAIEKATGQPYERYLDAALFSPLALRSLHHCKATPVLPNEATGYVRRRGAIVVAPWENMNTARSDGGLCGNAVDLARWTRLLARGDAVSAAAIEQMTAPTTTTEGWTAPYGMGSACCRSTAGRASATAGSSADSPRRRPTTRATICRSRCSPTWPSCRPRRSSATSSVPSSACRRRGFRACRCRPSCATASSAAGRSAFPVS